jgi:mediator of RNA polymerase II transcription subunit 12
MYQFLNNGLQCITEMIENLHVDEPSENWEEHLHRAGDLLRVLTLIAEPLRSDDSLLPPLDSPIQERFFEATCKSFRDLESSMTSGQHLTEAGGGNSKITHAVIFLGRLLQFDLGFRGAWTPATIASGSLLSSTIFQLALVCWLFGMIPHLLALM